MSKILMGVIRLYQVVASPFLGSHCRFYPSCSEFTRQAVEKMGLRGIGLGLKRLRHCHPFHHGGYDPLENWIEK
jgi:putative membrane protein insertion efficiency factor